MNWEYRVVKYEAADADSFFGPAGQIDQRVMERDLNRLGAEGWEVTTSFDTSGLHGDSVLYVLVLKRPRG